MEKYKIVVLYTLSKIQKCRISNAFNQFKKVVIKMKNYHKNVTFLLFFNIVFHIETRNINYLLNYFK